MSAAEDTFETARRLRELGAEALTNEELLTLLLRDTATGESASLLARRVLSEQTFASLARGSPQALSRQSGLSPIAAARLASAIEISRRIEREAARLPERVGDTAEVYGWAKPRLVHLEQEELWLLAVDGRNHLRSTKKLCTGGRHGLSVTPAEVLRHALLEGAVGFILVHNHPSGSPEPSELDIRFTERIAAAAVGVGVPLLDHVVVATAGYASVPIA